MHRQSGVYASVFKLGLSIGTPALAVAQSGRGRGLIHRLCTAGWVAQREESDG